MNRYCLVVFKNTIGAIKGEQKLKEDNLDIEVMPTPSVITGSCGICIRFNENILINVKESIENNQLEINGLYIKNEEGFSRL
ncbi:MULTISPECIES: DUF3343 domain-containing protein [Clostridium]|uniref:DUF3343 domain-containing protein n=1 Tax=Clostridium paridis TaxID=2803863 RepID=A0A937FFJ5_9CLOT|nr:MULTISPECIES: DUF3343 domain-containing protein [Clostridium]MBL4930501.1 DUF3343 domain-containing protein [Clostridium paridis]MDD7796241.1 DUF3343 domain-containing protein [Clostridium sp. 'White wine YQ']